MQPEPYRISLLAGILATFLLIALAVLILVQLLMFKDSQSGSLTAIFSDTRIAKTVLFTIVQAGLSTMLSLALGIILAWSLANRRKFPFRNLLNTLISSALVLPTLVVVLGIVTIYGRNGWLAGLSLGVTGEPLPFSIYGLSGILIAHTYFNASFAARILLHRFEAIPDERHKLGFALGMGFWKKLKIIDLPAIIDALPALAITIFLLCFTSFAIVLTLGGSPSYNTLEVAIYEAVKFDFDLPLAFQLAMVQIAICIFLVVLTSARAKTSAPPSSANNGTGFEHLLSPWSRWFQSLTIALFALFFITPLLAIVIDGLGPQLVTIFADPTFLRALLTSIVIATASTIVALAFSLTIASALVTLSSPDRLGGMKLARVATPFLSIAAMLYLVFPALVMGLGLFMFSMKVGGNPTLWAAAVVTIANALFATPFAVTALRPAILGAAKKHDRLSASLGLGRLLRLKLIDWPALKKDVAYVAALAFCFSLGDMGVIALFGSDEFKTLPWLLYQKFGSYRTQDASAIALVLLILIIVVFSLTQVMSDKEQSN